MNKLFIGVDPGTRGAISVLDDKGDVYKRFHFPVDGNQIDVVPIVEFITSLKEICCSVYAVLEDVHSVFNASAKSNFTFGYNVGILHAIFAGSKIKFIKVQPKKWQKVCWEGVKPISNDPKTTSLIAAKRLFPHEDFLATKRSSVAHDGIVDAVLLSHYCYLYFK